MPTDTIEKTGTTRCECCRKALNSDDRMWFEVSAIAFCSPKCRVAWMKNRKGVTNG